MIALTNDFDYKVTPASDADLWSVTREGREAHIELLTPPLQREQAALIYEGYVKFGPDHCMPTRTLRIFSQRGLEFDQGPWLSPSQFGVALFSICAVMLFLSIVTFFLR